MSVAALFELHTIITFLPRILLQFIRKCFSDRPLTCVGGWAFLLPFGWLAKPRLIYTLMVGCKMLKLILSLTLLRSLILKASSSSSRGIRKTPLSFTVVSQARSQLALPALVQIACYKVLNVQIHSTGSAAAAECECEWEWEMYVRGGSCSAGGD